MSITEAFWSHPFDWQPHYLPRTTLSEVVLLVHIFRQPKVTDFDQEIGINPVENQVLSDFLRALVWDSSIINIYNDFRVVKLRQ